MRVLDPSKTANHRDAALWSENSWKKRVQKIKASSGGAVGVLFVWAVKDENYIVKPGTMLGTTETRMDVSGMGTVGFIVKPVAGAAVSTKMAETVLNRVAGAASPDSIEVARDSSGGRGIMYWVEQLRREGELDVKRYEFYRSAGCFLLQKMMSGYVDMGEAYRAGGDSLVNIVTNNELMVNLGKLAAADMIIGNGDRIERTNCGNIMFNAEGKIAAIDSATVLASFEQLKRAEAQQVEVAVVTSSMKQFVTSLTKFKAAGTAAPSNAQIDAAAREKGTVSVPTASTMMYSDEKFALTMFERFRDHLVENAKRHGEGINFPTGWQWTLAKQKFMKGYREGLNEVDELLGLKSNFRSKLSKAKNSKAWTDLKKEYKAIGYSGVDNNLSWFNLTVRREIYIQVRNGKSMDEAIAHATAIAAAKQAKALSSSTGGRRVL